MNFSPSHAAQGSLVLIQREEGYVVSSARLAAVIILAAGQGTRMRSATPKVLHPLCGRSLLGHAIAAARGLNPENLVVVVRHERDAVAAHALSCDPNIIIADQDEIMGTGRAVWCGLQELPADLHGPILVMAGDTPLLDTETLSELNALHGNNAVTVLTTNIPDPTGYGRILRTESGTICGVVEQKDADAAERAITEINTSTYVFDAEFLRGALANLSTSNAQGEMYLTDVVAAAYSAGHGVQGHVISDSWLVEGCNDLVQLAELRNQMNMRILEKWMRAGVSIVDPAQTSIDVGVEIAGDARIEPGTYLRGTTKVGAQAIICASDLADTEVGAGAKVRHVVAEGAHIAAGSVVPPFSFLPAENAAAGFAAGGPATTGKH